MQLRTAILVLGLVTINASAIDRPVENLDWAFELGNNLSVLEKNPQDKNALHGAWLACMRLGLYKEAEQFQASLSANEREVMSGDQIALAVRYGQVDLKTLTGRQRYFSIDFALSLTEDLAHSYLNGLEISTEQERRLNDRILALTFRHRFADAIELYQHMAAQHRVLPLWTHKEIAGAYLAERQPLQAKELYQQVLESPEDFDANIGLFYAQIESEQLDLAQQHIDQFAAGLPVRRRLDGSANTERTSADILSDQARVFTNHVDQAYLRNEERLQAIPFNSEARNVQVSVSAAMGWVRISEQEMRINIANDPNNAGLRAAHAEQLLGLQEWTQAHDELATASALDPYAPQLSNTNQTFALHQSAELNIESGYGQSDSNYPLGSSDHFVDAHFYSSPIDDAWRLFVHNYQASADLNDENVRWNRIGGGVEWRNANWQSSIEINGSDNSSDNVKTGLLTSVNWIIDDQWKLSAKWNSVTNDIPMQAVAAGLSANETGFGIEYQAFEGRKVSVYFSHKDFTDDNQKNTLTALWSERWFGNSRWTINTDVGADASKSTLGYAAAYFNPPDDRSVWITGTLQNLTSRSYDWTFKQRLSLTGGNYWQTDYGAGSVKGIEYQHSWDLGRSATLNYSIGRLIRPYDGVEEARTYGSVNLVWRF